MPPRFASIRHKKVLPTPLCFGDFHGYIKSMDSFRETTTTAKAAAAAPRETTFHGVGDRRNNENSDYKAENFILPASIKSRRTNNFHNDVSAQSGEEMKSTLEASAPEASADETHVYNACNRRVEYRVEESEFNSHRLSAKASLLSSTHDLREYLNFSCELHRTKRLSHSREMRAEGPRSVTLADDDVGMNCSIDVDDDAVRLSYPHGMLVEISGVDTITVDWLESKERGETKRTYSADGFVVVHNAVATRIFLANGAIYEIACEQQQQTKMDEFNQELTTRHRFAIAAADAFKKFICFESFVMTLASGQRFRVVGDSIVGELEPLIVHEWFDAGTCTWHTQRADGMRLLRTGELTKCQHADGTVITTRYHPDVDVLASSDEGAPRPPHTIGPLDALWRSEAENQSRLIIDDSVLDCVASEYFLKINQTCQFEHEKCGLFRFAVDGIGLKLFGGATMRKQSNGECEFSFSDGVVMRMSESKLRFYDGKCGECRSRNEILVKLTSNGVSDDDEVLVSAADIEGNLFEIKASGRPRFYASDTCRAGGECERCKSVKREFHTERYGERWLVLNRDMSGYEITPLTPNSSDKEETMKAKTTMLLCRDDGALHTMPIDDKEFNIDFPAHDRSEISEESTIGIMPSSETDLKRGEGEGRRSSNNSQSNVSSSSSNKMNRARMKGLKSLGAEHAVIEKQPSPWVTRDDSSVNALIQFYANPLDSLPESISVDAILKLQRSSLLSVIEATRRMAAHVSERSVVSVDTLTTSPAARRTFEEHFRLTMAESIQGYIREKLERFRESTARAIVEDLLQNAFARLTERSGSSSSEIDKCHLDKASDVIRDEFSNNRACAAAAAHPIAIKSFSFV